MNLGEWLGVGGLALGVVAAHHGLLYAFFARLRGRLVLISDLIRPFQSTCSAMNKNIETNTRVLENVVDRLETIATNQARLSDRIERIERDLQH